MRNDKHPRIAVLPVKVPILLKTEIQNIRVKEHRSDSSVAYFLLVKGMKAYRKDGMLIEDDDELEFLEMSGTPIVSGRQRNARK